MFDTNHRNYCTKSYDCSKDQILPKVKFCECNTRKSNGCSFYEDDKSFESQANNIQNVMSLQVQHGGDIHRILLESKKGCSLILSDAMRQIEKDLKIPVCKQRIFYKGIELQKFATTDLESLNIFQNSLIRVAGESGNENWIENFIRFH
jgi:hypothetical protein